MNPKTIHERLDFENGFNICKEKNIHFFICN